MAEDDDGQTARLQSLINRSIGPETINGGDEQPVHSPGQESLDAGRLAFFQVEGVGQDEFVAKFVGALLDGKQDRGQKWGR